MLSVASSKEYAYSESYYLSKGLLFVQIIQPTYYFPFKDVKPGDFIYPVIDVDYEGNNLTTLTKDNFTVEIGTKNAIINNATYDESTSYYRLNVTVPFNEEGRKQDFWVNVSYEDSWATDLQLESVWYFAPTLTKAPGYFPAKPTTIPRKDFSLDTDLIKVSFSPGKYEKRILKLKNTGEVFLRINMSQFNLENFLKPLEYSLDLDPGEEETINLDFSASEFQQPGIFPGKLIFKADGIEKNVIVIIEVESEKPLFDVKVEIPSGYKNVYPGEEVLAQIIIYNLGRIGRVDVTVEYGIMDLSRNVIVRDYEVVAVETQVSIAKSLTLPKNIKPENYVFYSEINYNGIIGTGSSMFTVQERWKLVIPKFLPYLIILIFIMIFAVLFVKVMFKYMKASFPIKI